MQFAVREPGQAAPSDRAVEQARETTLPLPLTALTPSTVLALQRTAGNAAVTGMLARAAAPATQEGADPQTCTAAEDAAEAEFMSREFPRKLIHPKTGNISGLFDAEYQPADGVLKITVCVAFRFIDGDRSDTQWISAVGGPEKAAQYADDEFVWAPQEQEKWKANATAKVRELWSERYRFYTQRPCWRRLPPVDVMIDIEPKPQVAKNGVEVGAAEGGPHHVFYIRKYPTEPRRRSQFAGSRELFLYEHGGEGGDGAEKPDVTHHGHTPSDDPAYQKIAGANPGRIDFTGDSDQIPGTHVSPLRDFGKALAGPTAPPFPVTVTGHTSSNSPEAAGMALSERRARNVADEIARGGARTPPRAIGVGKRGAAPTPEWHFAEIALGNFVSRQSTVGHEFGHIFGLGDEYPEGSRKVGGETDHSKAVKDLMPGEKPIVAHHSEDIMSVGEVVRPHHYVGFLSALAQLTGTEGKDWGVGPKAPQQFP